MTASIQILWRCVPQICKWITFCKNNSPIRIYSAWSHNFKISILICCIMQYSYVNRFIMYIATFWFLFMGYYSKGFGKRLLILHHGQDHINIERGAGFIRRNALWVEVTVCEVRDSLKIKHSISQNSCTAVSLSELFTLVYWRETGDLNVIKTPKQSL